MKIKDSGERREYHKHNIGDRHGSLVLVKRMPHSPNWLALCDCGNEVVYQVSSGQERCRECAYKKRATDMTKHGESPTLQKNASRLYCIWLNMRKRCNNPKDPKYKNYGGRGISICKEWQDYTVFRKWANRNGYSDSLSIDRIDPNGNYCPENCRWVDQKTQCRNKTTNHYLEYNGETKTMAEWAEIKGISYHTLKNRINRYGWSIKDALEKKVGEAR